MNIAAAFEEWYNSLTHIEASNWDQLALAFAAGVDFAAKANTELIKEYQETMEKISK